MAGIPTPPTTPVEGLPIRVSFRSGKGSGVHYVVVEQAEQKVILSATQAKSLVKQIQNRLGS